MALRRDKWPAFLVRVSRAGAASERPYGKNSSATEYVNRRYRKTQCYTGPVVNPGPYGWIE